MEIFVVGCQGIGRVQDEVQTQAPQAPMSHINLASDKQHVPSSEVVLRHFWASRSVSFTQYSDYSSFTYKFT